MDKRTSHIPSYCRKNVSLSTHRIIQVSLHSLYLLIWSSPSSQAHMHTHTRNINLINLMHAMIPSLNFFFWRMLLMVIFLGHSLTAFHKEHIYDKLISDLGLNPDHPGKRTN